MSIRRELEQFDGKHTEALERILSSHRPTHSLIGSLITLAANKEKNIQTGATWLLKRLAENPIHFTRRNLIALFGSLPELTHWLSKLHICQMLQYVEIPKDSTDNIVWFLERNLMHENKFLRAWSYNGFFELARQHQNYLGVAIDQLERGETDSAASVRARIRNIRKAVNRLQKDLDGLAVKD